MMCNCGPVPNPRRKRKSAKKRKMGIQWSSRTGKWTSAPRMSRPKKVCTRAEADKIARGLKRIVDKPAKEGLNPLEKAYVSLASGLLLNCMRSGTHKDRTNIVWGKPKKNRTAKSKKRAAKPKKRARKRTWTR